MDSKFIECPNCGHNWINTEKVCKYCGTANPNFKTAPNISDTLSKIRFNDSFINPNNKQDNNKTTVERKNNFSILLLILLFIFCWPLAIIYLVIGLGRR